MPFLPSDITGLIRWGKADSLSLSNNDPVDSYTDESGNGNHFVGSGTTRPLFKTAAQNGRAAVLFDGVDDFLTRDALAATFSGTGTPFTFFWAGKHSSLGNAHQCFFIAANITGSNQPTHDLFFQSETYQWWCDRRTDASVIKSLQAYEPDTNWHTLIFTYDGTTGILYVDGRQMTSNPLPGAGAMTVNSFTYASHRRSDGNDSYFNGYWGEDGIYDAAINSAQVTDLHAYLKERWATAGSPPSWIPSDLGTTLKRWATHKTWNFIANNAAATTWWNRIKPDETIGNLTTTGTFKTAIVAGKDAIQLNGTSNAISDSTVSAFVSGTSKAWTIFGVFQPTSIGVARCPFGFGAVSTTPLHRLQMNAANQWRADRRNDANTLFTQLTGTVTTAVHSFVYSFDGTNVTLWIDGAVVFNNLSLGTGAATVTTCQWGAFRSTEWMVGYYVECGFTDTATTGTNLTNLVNYLEGVAGRPVSTSNRRRRLLVGAGS